MRIEKLLISLGYDKNGEMDFGISSTIETLSLTQLKELREMIVVAIWCAEDMWRRKNSK